MLVFVVVYAVIDHRSSFIVIAMRSANCASVSVKPIGNCLSNYINTDIKWVYSFIVVILFYLLISFPFLFYAFVRRVFGVVTDAHKIQSYCAWQCQTQTMLVRTQVCVCGQIFNEINFLNRHAHVKCIEYKQYAVIVCLLWSVPCFVVACCIS